MAADNHYFDSNLLTDELEKLFGDTFGSRVAVETKLYDDFSNGFIQEIKEYETNVALALKNDSVQALLFENARFCNAIFSKLEEVVKEKDPDAFAERINNLKNRAFKLMDIIPESPELSRQIQSLNTSLEKNSSFKPNFKKKPKGNSEVKESKATAKESGGSELEAYRQYPNRSFFFHYLITKNLQEQIVPYETFLTSIIKLLVFLVSIDKKRIENFQKFAEKNYDLKEGVLVQKLTYDVDELKGLIANFQKTSHEIVEGLTARSKSFLSAFETTAITESKDYEGKVNINKEFGRLLAALTKTRTGWHNTIFILSEDWKIELEIHAFEFYILKEYFDFSDVINVTFTIPVEETIELMTEELKKVSVGVDSVRKGSKKDFQKKFTQVKFEFKRNILLKIIPSLKETILKAELPKAIDRIENGTSSKFGHLSQKRNIVKHPDYNRQIDHSEFESISLRGLVGYEIMPKLKKVFPNLKTAFIQHVELFETKVAEIPEIIDFAIASSISYFEKEKNEEEAINITTEGIERTENKLDDLAEMHKSFLIKEVETLQESIEQFLGEIIVITDSESASQINIRIAKLKAIEKSKAIRTEFFNKVKNLLPIGLKYAKKGVSYLTDWSEQVSKQFRVDTDQLFITSDTSDYLNATEKAIQQLPFIYQRLFKIEPLSTFELFMGRTKPIEELNLAYSKWKEGRFAPVVVIGEKGSGKTTLVNWFLKMKIQNEKLIILDLLDQNKPPEAVYIEIEAIVASIMESNSSGSTEPKTIVVIDGLERLFNAEINGFQYLLKTMKLISESHSKIFWIAISHLYSWYFMDKSYKLSDFFAYHIKLTDISPSDIRAIIEKRHNISGFRLVFESSPAKKTIVPFKKTGAVESQEVLEEAYFKNLTEHNKNNLSQAFLYWLFSTSKVTDDVIYIKPISEMDNSFVKAISVQKMVVLKNILIHNGITIEGHARTFGCDIELSKLTLYQLMDDGLVVKNNDFYLVNPLIYSQIINQLYILNLLH